MKDALNILIVEDATLVALHLKKTLQSQGHKVIGSLAYAEAAVEFVQEQQPDLILMDIMLKGELDGVEAAKIIQSEFDIPILFLSALTDEDTLERINEIKVNGMLNKPFHDVDLHDKVMALTA